MDGFMTLQELCKVLGVTRRAVQGYEKAGLVKASSRNKYGYLLYDSDAVGRIARVKFYQDMGFSIRQIVELMDTSSIKVHSAVEAQLCRLEAEKRRIDNIIEKAQHLLKE